MVSQSQEIIANYRSARSRLWAPKPAAVRRELVSPAPTPQEPKAPPAETLRPPQPKPVAKVTLPVVPSMPKYAVRSSGLPLANPEAIALVEKILEKHKLTWREVASPTRRKPVSRARQEVYYLLRLRGLSYPQIARICGRNDHACVIHGVKVHAARENLFHPDAVDKCAINLA